MRQQMVMDIQQIFSCEASFAHARVQRKGCVERSVSDIVCSLALPVQGDGDPLLCFRNEVLRLTSNMPMHPLPILLNNGVPVSISSDDPGIFGNAGLSFDMYQVLIKIYWCLAVEFNLFFRSLLRVKFQVLSLCGSWLEIASRSDAVNVPNDFTILKIHVSTSRPRAKAKNLRMPIKLRRSC